MDSNYENVICHYGEEARDTLALLERDGARAALAHLREQHDPGAGTMASSRIRPWKDSDETFQHGDYVLYFNRDAGYVGLAYELRLD